MDTDAEAQAAIQGLNDQEYDGRRLTVNEAKPREPRSGGGGGYGGGGGGGGAAATVAAAAAAVAASGGGGGVVVAGAIDQPRATSYMKPQEPRIGAPGIDLSLLARPATTSRLYLTGSSNEMPTNPGYRHGPILDTQRKRCPVCHQSVYSLAGIHPQCASSSLRGSRPPSRLPPMSSLSPPCRRCREPRRKIIPLKIPPVIS